MFQLVGLTHAIGLSGLQSGSDRCGDLSARTFFRESFDEFAHLTVTHANLRICYRSAPRRAVLRVAIAGICSVRRTIVSCGGRPRGRVLDVRLPGRGVSGSEYDERSVHEEIRGQMRARRWPGSREER
jgi:hypothetical protein